MPTLILLFLTVFSLIHPLYAEQAAPPATEFIRVQHTKKQAILQTATTRYSKGDVQVDLIGAVHIADKPYYEKLNTSFKNYNVLLFEMIGGEDLGQGRPLPEKADNAEPAPISVGILNTMFDTMQSLLALSSQKDHIDYTSKNFLHADLTLKEFTELQKKRNESLFSLILQEAMQEESAHQPSSLALLLAFASGNPDKLKLQLVNMLGHGDNQMDQMAGDNVIIGDRNIKCLNVMDQQIKAGTKSIGIFYGAAHFPDMEKRLLKQGFKKTQQTWQNAWVIQK